MSGDGMILENPVGTLIDVAAGPYGTGTATWNRARTHRFRLSRVWDPQGPRVAFVLLNPSTASAEHLDPTVTRCVKRAMREGYGSVEVVNIFALQATDPSELYTHPAPVGRGNDEAIVAAGRAAQRVICGWGTHGALQGRGAAVLGLLEGKGIEPWVLSLTKHGHPGHPLYLRNDIVARPLPLQS